MHEPPTRRYLRHGHVTGFGRQKFFVHLLEPKSRRYLIGERAEEVFLEAPHAGRAGFANSAPVQACAARARIRSIAFGVGSGLLTSKSIVEGHGGALTLTSEVGVGTTVTVMLPASGQIARAAESE